MQLLTPGTTLDFARIANQQGAGLMTYYNRHKFHVHS